jgi:hypothetical protein
MTDNMAMITLIAIAAPIAAIVSFDALAARFGRDSRPDFNESRPLA